MYRATNALTRRAITPITIPTGPRRTPTSARPKRAIPRPAAARIPPSLLNAPPTPATAAVAPPATAPPTFLKAPRTRPIAPVRGVVAAAVPAIFPSKSPRFLIRSSLSDPVFLNPSRIAFRPPVRPPPPATAPRALLNTPKPLESLLRFVAVVAIIPAMALNPKVPTEPTNPRAETNAKIRPVISRIVLMTSFSSAPLSAETTPLSVLKNTSIAPESVSLSMTSVKLTANRANSGPASIDFSTIRASAGAPVSKIANVSPMALLSASASRPLRSSPID